VEYSCAAVAGRLRGLLRERIAGLLVMATHNPSAVEHAARLEDIVILVVVGVAAEQALESGCTVVAAG
jgi:hypothetical protein